MADTTITLTKPIPAQLVNEGAAYGPLNLRKFLQIPNEKASLHFQAELSDGRALPQGLICTEGGILAGIPGEHTQGAYDIVLTVMDKDAPETPLKTNFKFTIKERIALDHESQLYTKIKSEVWDALENKLPLPEIADIFNRPLTAVEMYYLMQRFATLTIWDVYNLDSPGEKQLLNLADMNEHYVAYDRGSCLVVGPKDLFSHQRTLADALAAARSLAREAHARGWVLELSGFDKLVRAAWIELRHQGDKTGKYVEVLHYEPTNEDVKLYLDESQARSDMNLGSAL